MPQISPVFLCFFLLLDVFISQKAGNVRLKAALNQQRIIPVLHNLFPLKAREYASALDEAHIAFTTSMRHDQALETIKELSRYSNQVGKQTSLLRDETFTFGVSTMHDATQVSVEFEAEGLKYTYFRFSYI